jgi:hypothetical protein
MTYNTNSTSAHGIANGLSRLALPDGRQDGNEDDAMAFMIGLSHF